MAMRLRIAARSRSCSAANSRARSRSSALPKYRDGTLRLQIVYLVTLSFTGFSSKTIGAIERAADRTDGKPRRDPQCGV
ncbi:hypothetical protein NX871_23705 [Burkholderia thailandensis]|uniref:hypothetical protein n=1 Tax=Burkholderia thailandensis TaxID=57975 RepID=UPI00217DD54C|nr:hypothetical protein [Burkholderia thailandensis]MCS6472937.1 hypothetical protein [Burkholderia thailandensis]